MMHLFTTVYCSHCGFKKEVPTICGDRFCPVCGHYRRNRIRYKLSILTTAIKPPPGMNLKFITLTIPHETDLSTGVKSILRSFRNLRSKAFWKNYVYGGAFVIEITGKAGAWHIHIHAILHARFIPQALLSRMWKRVSAGSIVWISRIPVQAAVSYLTKYLAKSSVHSDLAMTVSMALKGCRLFQPFGAWHNFKIKIPRYSFRCPECQGDKWFLIEFPHWKFDVLLPASSSP